MHRLVVFVVDSMDYMDFYGLPKLQTVLAPGVHDMPALSVTNTTVPKCWHTSWYIMAKRSGGVTCQLLGYSGETMVA